MAAHAGWRLLGGTAALARRNAACLDGSLLLLSATPRCPYSSTIMRCRSLRRSASPRLRFNRNVRPPLFAAALLAAALFQGAIIDVAGNRAAREQFALVSKRIDSGASRRLPLRRRWPDLLLQIDRRLPADALPVPAPRQSQCRTQRRRDRPADRARAHPRASARRSSSPKTARARAIIRRRDAYSRRELAAQLPHCSPRPRRCTAAAGDLRVWQRRDLAPPRAQ